MYHLDPMADSSSTISSALQHARRNSPDLDAILSEYAQLEGIFFQSLIAMGVEPEQVVVANSAEAQVDTTCAVSTSELSPA